MTRKSKKKHRESYRYLPLEHEESIRLLELLPGKTNKRIQCRLITADVDSDLPYEAISYVWGKPKDKTRVLCHSKLVKIPTNLLHALQRFRHERESRILWADSICINQRNLVERRKQVQIMGKIFENARQVLVWLGRDPQHHAKPGFDLMTALIPSCRHLQYPLTENQMADFVSHIEQFPSFQWNALDRVLHNPWFSRIWVLQEISLAKEGLAVCGEAQIAWNDLRTIVKAIYWAAPRSLVTSYLNVNKAHELTSMDFRDSTSTARLLSIARKFGCSDPRDKIYALLAHNSFHDATVVPISGSSIPVDYTLPYSKLYFSVAKWLLERSNYGPFVVLSLVYHTRETIEDIKITSWVPRWDISYHNSGLMIGKRKYFASGDLSPRYLLNGLRLEVYGIKFDSIKWQSQILEEKDFELDDEKFGNYTLINIWKQLGSLEQGILTEEEMLQRFCSTLNAGKWARGGSKHRTGISEAQRVADCIAFFEAAGINLATNIYMKNKYGPGNRVRFLETTLVSESRRFFVTERGYYGIGPEVSLKRDSVIIPFGAEVPYVLWAQEAGDFRLCGECYVHGIMNGEAVGMWRNGELEEQCFILS